MERPRSTHHFIELRGEGIVGNDDYLISRGIWKKVARAAFWVVFLALTLP